MSAENERLPSDVFDGETVETVRERIVEILYECRETLIEPGKERELLEDFYIEKGIQAVHDNWRRLFNIFFNALDTTEIMRQGFVVEQWRRLTYPDGKGMVARINASPLADELMMCELDVEHRKLVKLAEYYPDDANYKAKFLELYENANLGFQFDIFDIYDCPQLLRGNVPIAEYKLFDNRYALQLPGLSGEILPQLSEELPYFLEPEIWRNDDDFEDLFEEAAYEIARLVAYAEVPQQSIISGIEACTWMPQPWLYKQKSATSIEGILDSHTYIEPFAPNNN